jgi:hypothetical protein
VAKVPQQVWRGALFWQAGHVTLLRPEGFGICHLPWEAGLLARTLVDDLQARGDYSSTGIKPR